MKLTDYLPVQLGQTTVKSSRTGSSYTSATSPFDNMLNKKVIEAETGPGKPEKSVDLIRKQPDRSRKVVNDKPNSKEPEAIEAQPAPDADQTNQTNKPAETGKTPKEAGGNQVAVEPETLDDAEIAALTEQLAAALGIGTDEVLRMLTTLNITAAELTVPENVTALVQAFYNVNAPVELLWEPGAAETANDINEAVQSFMESLTEVNEPVTVQETIMTHAAVQVETENLPAEIVATESKPQAELQPMLQEDEFATPLPEESRVFDGPKVKEVPEEVADEPLESGEANPGVSETGLDESTQASGQRVITTSRTETHRQITPNPVQSESAGTNPAFDPFQALNGVTSQELTEVTAGLASRGSHDVMEIINQITDQLKVEVKADTTELRLTLKPESLGEVSMRILTQNGVVTAQFFAESQRVKEIIESQLNDLRNSLQEKGVDVAEMAAFVGQDPNGREGANQADGRYDDGFAISRVRTRQTQFQTDNGGEAGEEPETAETDALGNPLEVNIIA